MFKEFLTAMRKRAAVDIKPITGKWVHGDKYPLVAKVRGEMFIRSLGLEKNDAKAQYRDTRTMGSKHMHVRGDGTYVIDHKDEYNPHFYPHRHFLDDVVPAIIKSMSSIGKVKQ